MSATRTYNLQTCTGAGVATQSSSGQRPSLSCITTVQEGSPNVLEASPKPKTAVKYCSYSDTVASRLPSPQQVKKTTNSPAGLASKSTSSHAFPEQTAVCKADHNNVEKMSSSDASESPKDRDSLGWTTINHRHASSLSLLHRTKRHSIRSEPTLITKEQKHTVKAAADALSQQQRQQIQQRNNKLTIRRDSTSSQGKGLAQSKGKAVDPREWGNANLSKADMDSL